VNAGRRPPIGRWLSTAQTAETLGCSENHVRRLIETGALDASNIAVQTGDCRWRISERAIAEFTAARTYKPVRLSA
jgi:excisionase family DNA binding protein